MRYVESYWAEELPNGVIHLLINCSQREIHYHAFSDTTYLIAGTEEEYENWSGDNLILSIDDFLPKNKDVTYIMTSMKEKEQLSFYWIPYEKDFRKKSKELLNINLQI